MSDKIATSIDEQINLLKKRGMIIPDEEKAKEILLDIGYFRLGFYCFPFETSFPQKNNRTHIYKQDASFKDVVDLYYFDSELRAILLKYLTRIEVNFRTHVTHIVSMSYLHSNIWFVDKNIVKDAYADNFESKVYTDKFRMNHVIKQHHISYPKDDYAPAWKTVEFMTFGAVIILFTNLIDDKIKGKIALSYGIKKVHIFINYLNVICSIRNICAHGSVLYDLALEKGIYNGPAKCDKNDNRHNLTGAIEVIKYFLNVISVNRSADFESDLVKLELCYRDNKVLKEIINKCSGLNIS